jgi:recombination protein RecA
MNENTTENLIKAINKKSGTPVISLGVNYNAPNRLKSGIFQFDLATGGGVPEGFVTIVYGTESSLKTTLTLKLIAQAQKKYPEKKAVFIDAEGRFSKDWARTHGVDVDILIFVVPSNAEQAVDIFEGLVQADDVSIVVLDSLAALVTVHELGSDAEKAMVGTAGLLINKFYRKLTHALNENRKAGNSQQLYLINQIRFKVGVMFGDPETMPGGPSFKFASSLTIRLYGKDVMVEKVNKALPAYKEINAIIKKWSIPVVQRNFKMMVAMMPIPEFNLKVGGVYDWKTVLAYLKTYDLLVKTKGGWGITDASTGEVAEFPTQDAIEQKMFDDPDFAALIKDMIVDVVIKKGDMIDPE